jgi:hypothetical protein
MAPDRDVAYVEDLTSRNGTYLGGEPVRERVVAREGSRIQLGASIFLVRLRERPDEVDFAETGTVSLECMSSHGDIDGGDLGSLGLVELLRLVFNAQRSVTLHVALPEEHHACVEIRGGEVHAAEVAGQRGFQALVRLARQTSGIFWLVETDAPCTRNVHEHGVRLIADLARALDPSAVRS